LAASEHGRLGGYEGPSIIEGNDTPGVLGARAARILLGRWDVHPGDPVAVLDPQREGRAFARLAEDRGLDVVRVDEPEWIEGDKRVEAVVGDRRRHEVEAAVVDPGLSPSAELGRQAGVPYTWRDELGGRVPLHRPEGTTPAPDVYVAGTCAGVHPVEAALAQGRAAGRGAAGEPTQGPRKAIEAAGLDSDELEALRSVWNE
jgi:NAD(P)H-nitrite reductase large subunit